MSGSDACSNHVTIPAAWLNTIRSVFNCCAVIAVVQRGVNPADDTSDLMALHIDPSLFLQAAPEELPPYFPNQLQEAWQKEAAAFFAAPILWVRHPASGVIHSWRVESNDAVAIARLQTDGPTALPPETLSRLERLGAVFRTETRDIEVAAFMRGREAAQQSLRRHGVAILRNLMHPGYSLQVRAYFAHIWDRIKLGDEQVPRRRAKHNDVLCRALHHSLNEAIGTVCEEAIKPSYCYLGIYMPGAVLTRHTDRPQCRWNASLLLDSVPDATAENGWPIYVECPDDRVRSAVAGIGDVIVYNGAQSPHWREEMPARFEYQSICFFHFVRAEFRGKLS